MNDINKQSFSLGELTGAVKSLKDDSCYIRKRIDKTVTSTVFYSVLAILSSGFVAWLSFLTKIVVQGG